MTVPESLRTVRFVNKYMTDPQQSAKTRFRSAMFKLNDKCVDERVKMNGRILRFANDNIFFFPVIHSSLCAWFF